MSLSWLESLRQHADLRFREVGLPDGRSEAFKYTSLQGLKNVHEAKGDATAAPSLPTVGRPRLAMVDGMVVESNLPDGLTAGPMAQFLGQLEGKLGCLLGEHAHGLAALNLARFQDGLYLNVAPGEQSLEPLHLAQAVSGGTCQCRHFIELGAGAKADVLITTSGRVKSAAHINEVMEVILGPNAELDLTWIHRGDDGLFSTQELAVRQERGSQLNVNLFALQAGTLRHGIRVDQVGEDASVRVAGLSLAEGGEHADFHLDLRHAAARGQSDQLFRGLVKRGGRVVVSGKVTVSETGGGSDANQSLRGLLLEPGGEWDARPQLEIYTEDVSASHGATVGNLDSEALFFLRSRGLDEAVARRILAGAFAREIPERVTDSRIANLIMAAVDQRLEAMLNGAS